MAMQYSARDVSILVRDALQAYEERQMGGGTPTLLVELEQESAWGLNTIQVLVDAMAKQRRLWLTNGLSELIADPESVIDGVYSRERWAEIKAVFDAFGRWLETPTVVQSADSESGMPEIAIPPIVIISRRGNPAVRWGVPVPTPDLEITEGP